MRRNRRRTWTTAAMPNSLIVRGETCSGARNSEALAKLVVQQAAAGLVGLEPLAVDHQLRNCPFAHVSNHLGRSSRIPVHVDLGVGKTVRVQKLLCRAAVTAPGGRINLDRHNSTLDAIAATICDDDHR